MESAASIFDSLSANKPSGTEETNKSKDAVAQSVAASQFYDLFSGNLAKSYAGNEGSQFSSRDTVKATQESSLSTKAEENSGSEKTLFNSINAPEKSEKYSPTDNHESRKDSSNKDSSNNEVKTSENRTEVEKTDVKETKPAKVEPEKAGAEKAKTVKQEGRQSESKVVEIRAKATKVIENSGKTVAQEATTRTAEVANIKKADVKRTIGKETAKTQQQTEVKIALSPKIEKGAELMLDSKSIKVSANAKADAAPVIAKQDVAEAVPANRESSSSNNGNNNQNTNTGSPAIPPAESFAAKVSNLSGKSFSQLMQEAKGISPKSGANGSQVSPGSATIQYNRRAGEVSFSSKAHGTVKTTPGKIISQIVKAARISVNNGTQEMKLLLKPEELGWMRVKITITDGKMTAHFGVENEAVKSLLENNMSQLQQALNGQNLKVNQILIDVNAQSDPDSAMHKGDADARNGKKNLNELENDEDAKEEIFIGEDLQLIELSAVNVMI